MEDLTMHPENMQLVTPGANGLNMPSPQMAVAELAERNKLVLALMDNVLVPEVHYGKIPGCGNKPSLFLPGAEKLAAVFRMAPKYTIDRVSLPNGHVEYDVKCALYSYNGIFLGEGAATCSSMESKYRYRQGAGEDTGVRPPRNYWDLKKTDFKAAQALIGGPGFTVKKNAEGNWSVFTIVEKAENPDIADQFNTVKKMACKRALVHAVRTCTGTADLFTQDIEDFRDNYSAIIVDAEVETKPQPKPQPKPPQASGPARDEEYPFDDEPFHGEPEAPAGPSEADMLRTKLRAMILEGNGGDAEGADKFMQPYATASAADLAPKIAMVEAKLAAKREAARKLAAAEAEAAKRAAEEKAASDAKRDAAISPAVRDWVDGEGGFAPEPPVIDAELEHEPAADLGSMTSSQRGDMIVANWTAIRKRMTELKIPKAKQEAKIKEMGEEFINMADGTDNLAIETSIIQGQTQWLRLS